MYIDYTSLEARFGAAELIDLSNTGGDGESVDMQVISTAMDDATRLIDGYIGSRVNLPLTPAQVEQTSLQRIAADVTRYYLMDTLVSDEVKKRYDDAVKVLRDVQKGAVTLGVTPRGGATSTNVCTVSEGESRFEWGAY